MPLVARLAVRAEGTDPARIGDIAGLDAVDAEARVEVERGRQLRLVARDVAGSLVMPDQAHAALARVAGDRFEVEVRVRLA